MLSPDQVGSRVVVRRRLPPGAGASYGDVLGDLLSWDAGVLTVHTRLGEVEVAERDVVAGRPVPPPPARRTPLPRTGPLR